MTIITINREPSWGDMAVGAIVNLPPTLADPLIASGEAVPTPDAVPTQVWSGSVVTVGGAPYMQMPDGSLMPLAIMAGTPHEPEVAGVVQQVVSLDHGSDADHVEILMTFNCTTGDPDTPDTDLASARFTSPDSNAEVIKTGVIGESGGYVEAYAASITTLHFGLRGAGPYTVAAANILTALQMVVMTFASSLNITVVEVRMGSSTAGGGSNKRYRTITVTGYSS